MPHRPSIGPSAQSQTHKTAQDVLRASGGYRPAMAEDDQGPGAPEVAKAPERGVSELVGGLDSLAVSSEGAGDADKNPNAADTPPSNEDEGLAIVPFGPPPPTEDCPVCFIPLPRGPSDIAHMSCCGKRICRACNCEIVRVLGVKNAKRAEKKLKPLECLCPFCREPVMAKSDDDMIRRYEKRVERGDSYAMHSLAGYYRDGRYGLAKDLRKSSDLVRRAADLGHVIAIAELGALYAFGAYGVSLDEIKGRELLEKAAKKGYGHALLYFASLEGSKGRNEFGLTYLRAAAAAGVDLAVENLWNWFKAGTLSKDDLEESLRAHQKANEDMRSEQRERYKRWKKVQEKKKQEQAKA